MNECLFLQKKMSALHSLVVEEITPLTPSAVTLTLALPDDLKEEFTFIAGQYLTLEAQIDSATVRRAYSLCSAPHENRLTVGIKKVPSGLFSSYANEKLNIGDSLKVGVPEGRFIYHSTNEEQSILALAAGSGITPIFAMLKSALETSPKTTIHLLYGNKNPEESMFKAALAELEATSSGRLKVHWIYSQSNEENALFGRIDTAAIRFVLNQMGSMPNQTFLCGPEGMIDLAKATLTELSVAEDTIHFELFTSSTASTDTFIESSDEVELTIKVDDSTHQITSSSNKSLLDIALQEKIEVPYSCQGGVCCSCIAKVSSGKVEMENNQILTDDEIEDGLVLTCQAFPKSATITVDYDDV